LLLGGLYFPAVGVITAHRKLIQYIIDVGLAVIVFPPDPETLAYLKTAWNERLKAEEILKIS
jgi:hypothetical protein